MKQMIETIEQTPMTLRVRLKNPDSLDMDMLSLMENDALCLPCLVENEKKGILMYTLDHLVPLSHFLNEYSFEHEEGYLFLKRLLEDTIHANRNKPVLLHPDFVFVSPYGDAFRFLILPVHVQYWMYQKDTCKEWALYIQNHFQTQSAYEIPGYILMSLKQPEFSITNLILGLDEMQNLYYPRKWFKKRGQHFKTKEAITAYAGFSVTEEDEEGTQILSDIPSMQAYLQLNKETFYLKEELTLIGRDSKCDICLPYPEISSQHARISCTQGRYYIQDLKSKNGTFLNSKKVQRKMRLKDGMQVDFGNHSLIFHDVI